MISRHVIGTLVLAAAASPTLVLAQAPADVAVRSATSANGAAIPGPPPPVAPATVARDGQGVTLRAVRISQALKIDGNLDEEFYATVPPMSDFVQMEPRPGAPATEKTDLWIGFDATNLYVTVRCFDSQPESRWVANEMRRDSFLIPRNENVAFIVDTFFDRRNSFAFEVTPIGGFWDGQVMSEKTSTDWNPVWTRKTGRFPGGWTAEMAIPFKSLRYTPGTIQVWGFNMRRTIRWKNEETYLKPLPLISGQTGSAALFQVSNAATLVGIEAPAGSKNLEIKPYVLASTTTDRLATLPVSNAGDAQFGVDAKYGITQNLTADFTYNTDFAQAEIDSQQVNLTRFSLFFPEKRDFFLESAGIFNFGGAVTSGPAATASTPILFFSRRIGLNGGRAIPIHGGGRLTGRVGAYTVGLIDVQAGDEAISETPATNFSVVRLRRDIMRRSSVGVLFGGRSKSTVGNGSAETYGVDTALRFTDFLALDAYLAKTTTPRLSGRDLSYRAHLTYSGDRYGLEGGRTTVQENFFPDTGFLQRTDYQRTYGLARFSPRPKSMPSVRKLTYQSVYDYYSDNTGRMQSRDGSLQFSAEMQSGDMFSARYDRQYEFIARSFAIASGVTIPVGGYAFQYGQIGWAPGSKRRVSGAFSLERGSFYNGDRTTFSYSTGRIFFLPQFAVEPGASINKVDLAQGSFTSTVFSSRATFSFTPEMFFSGLVQYASATHSFGSNLRLRWEYQPGSELFIVYTDDRDTTASGPQKLRNRAFVVKINRLVRF